MSELADEVGTVEESQAVEPGGVQEETAPEPAAPAAPEVPAFDPNEMQARLEQSESRNAELYSILEEMYQQGQLGQPQPQAGAIEQAAGAPQFLDEFGNFDPQQFAAYQSQRDQQLLQQVAQMFQPLQETFAQQQESAHIAEGEQRLNDILADDIARNGEFASDPDADAKAREWVGERASMIFAELAQQYGATPRVATMAMERGIAEVRSFIGGIGGAAVARNQNELATLAGAPGEPGVGGGGLEAPVIRIGETSAQKFARQ